VASRRICREHVAVNYLTHINRESGGLDWWCNGAQIAETGYYADLLADEAIGLVKVRDTSKPFLLESHRRHGVK